MDVPKKVQFLDLQQKLDLKIGQVFAVQCLRDFAFFF